MPTKTTTFIVIPAKAGIQADDGWAPSSRFLTSPSLQRKLEPILILRSMLDGEHSPGALRLPGLRARGVLVFRMDVTIKSKMGSSFRWNDGDLAEPILRTQRRPGEGRDPGP